MFIPYSDSVTATLQAQTANLASVRWGYISYDTTDDDVLDTLTVRAGHSCYLLTEQTTSVIHLGFIAASLTSTFQFPSHLLHLLRQIAGSVLSAIPLQILVSYSSLLTIACF